MLLVYIKKESPRFKYIVKQILERTLGIPVNITLKLEEFVAHAGPKFSYADQPLSNELFFQSSKLLFEKGVNEDTIAVKDWNGLPCFFPVAHKESAVPFDVFAASFYMLSRYEEYLPQVKDHLGRFMAKNSLAFENGFLQEPVVDYWAQRIKQVLLNAFPDLSSKNKKFNLLLLCEVNEAFAYQKKGWFRTMEGIFTDIFQLEFIKLFYRFKVLIGAMKDPFHTYNYIINKARKANGQIKFFFGLGNYSSHEKSTSYHSSTYQRLIKAIADYCDVGVRLSFNAQKHLTDLKLEKKRFEQITHLSASTVFCQYAKISLPNTYRILTEQEFTSDYSMGYIDHAGFRAGTCIPFLFYDLDYEVQTPLKVIPFCLTHFAFKKINVVDKAITETEQLFQKVKNVGGTAVIHLNNELFDDTNPRSRFWKKMYDFFLEFH